MRELEACEGCNSLFVGDDTPAGGWSPDSGFPVPGKPVHSGPVVTPGNTVRIYLADGSPTGIRHAELVNLMGEALVCLCSKMTLLKAWEEAPRPGKAVERKPLEVHQPAVSRKEDKEQLAPVQDKMPHYRHCVVAR